MIDKLLRENSPIVRRPLFIRSKTYDTSLISKLTLLQGKYKNLKEIDKFYELLERYERKLKPKSFLDWVCYSLDDDRINKLSTLNYFMATACD